MRGSKSVFVRYGARVLVLVLGLAAAPLACLAATINVTTTGDAGGAGGCTVRQAIATINNGAGPDANTGNCSIASGTLGTNDTIHFDLATFPNGGGNTITLADASTSTLSIYAANLIIDATANGQVVIQRPSGAANKFGIVGDFTAGSLTLNHLTLSNGAGGVCAGDYGGGGGIGICATGVNLTLNNCTLSGNSSDNRGGGIWSEYGSVTLNNSTLSGNSASSKDGGGIFSNNVTGTLNNSTVSGNSAPNGGGGGVEVLTGSLTLTNSTLSSNQAKGGGGIDSNNGSVTLSNSTLSGNSCSSPFGAGGINQTGAGDAVTATNSTISANTGGYYGGIFGNPGSIQVINSIVAGNSGSYPYQIPPFFNGSGSITDGDPQLGALANNGGLTQTMRPLPGSPAIDAIACTNAPAADQRGIVRPQGVQCDIGAVEVVLHQLTANVTTAGGAVSATSPTPASGGITACSNTAGTCTAGYLDEVSAQIVTLAATPDPGYRLTAWGGDCASDGTVTVDANKTCTAAFAPNLLSGTLGGLNGGSLSLHLDYGTGTQDVGINANGPFAFTSAVPSGATYTVSVTAQPSTQICTVTHASGTMPAGDVGNVAASCVAASGVLQLSVDDGHLYARYGHIADYTVTLSYSGSTAATHVSVSNTATAGLDLPNALWCQGPACAPSTQGALNTSADLPANGSVTWLISVPVLANTTDPTVTLSASAGGIGASDTDTLVVYRDSFDVANGGGVASLTPNVSANEVFTLPVSNGGAIADVYQSHSGNVRVQSLVLGGQTFVRLLAREGAQERASAWARAHAGATLALGSLAGASDQRFALLEGAEQSIVLPIAH